MYFIVFIVLLKFVLMLMCLFQEICARPKFISESTSRFDIEQGELGKSEIIFKH